MKQTKIEPMRVFFVEYYEVMETSGFCWFENYFKDSAVNGRYVDPSQARDILPSVISGEVYELDLSREAIWKMIKRVDGIFEVKNRGYYSDHEDFDPSTPLPGDEEVLFMYPPMAALRIGDNLAIVGSE